MTRKKWYILVRADHTAAIEKCAAKPTEETHGYTYRYAWGPFDTRADAERSAQFQNLVIREED